MKKNTILPLILIFILTFTLQAQERKIAIGDFLEIVVFGHQEMTRTVQVNPQGMINFPFVQSLPVKGITLEQLRKVIASQLARYLEEYPIVTISFSTINTIAVNVLGYVQNPGLFQIPQYSTLQGAIQHAGGVLPGAWMKKVQLIRKDQKARKPETFNLEKFIQEGDLGENPILSNEDMIIVTGNPISGSVKVIGMVNSPGNYQSMDNATVLDMIFQAGGPTEEANFAKIKVISFEKEVTYDVRVDLKNYFNSTTYKEQRKIYPGDIIIVPPKARIWRSTMTILRDIGSIIMILWYLERVRN